MINSLSCPEKGKNKGQHAVTIHPHKVIKPCDLPVHSQPLTPKFQNSSFGLEFKKKKKRERDEAVEMLLLYYWAVFLFFLLREVEPEFSTVNLTPDYNYAYILSIQ